MCVVEEKVYYRYQGDAQPESGTSEGVQDGYDQTELGHVWRGDGRERNQVQQQGEPKESRRKDQVT